MLKDSYFLNKSNGSPRNRNMSLFVGGGGFSAATPLAIR
jgi:hypothetical protein